MQSSVASGRKFVCDAEESDNVDLTVPSWYVGLYGQAEKRIWWMPWQLEAMKDVVACDKSRGASKQALIREFPNGETHRFGGICTRIKYGTEANPGN